MSNTGLYLSGAIFLSSLLMLFFKRLSSRSNAVFRDEFFLDPLKNQFLFSLRFFGCFVVCRFCDFLYLVCFFAIWNVFFRSKIGGLSWRIITISSSETSSSWSFHLFPDCLPPDCCSSTGWHYPPSLLARLIRSVLISAISSRRFLFGGDGANTVVIPASRIPGCDIAFLCSTS